jgi:hypothetical protein
MKRKATLPLIVTLAFFLLVKCTKSPIEKHQGVYIVDKDSLKTLMKKTVDSDNRLAVLLVEKVIENAVIEFELKGDSVDGVLFLAGETTILNSSIKLRNDSMVIDIDDKEGYLIPTENGITFRNKGSELSLPMVKAKQNAISANTRQVLTKLTKEAEQVKKFESELGMWQKGNFVDEFGDRTGGGFAVAIVRGNSQSSITSNSNVLVKAVVQGNAIYFEIYNENMSMKESLPDREFGQVKIKFPNGDIKSEKVFFYKNTISESPTDKRPLIYNHLLNAEAELKVFLDLSTTNRFHSDTYQFSLRRNNLMEVLTDLGLAHQ